jgi:triacylglycerol lipase
VSTVVLVLLALLMVVAVVATVVIRRRLPRVPPLRGVTPFPGEPERGPPLPVVLVHGLFGFDRIGIPGVKLHYFRGIVKHLESLGCHAHAVRLPAAASVPDRAKILVEKIVELGHERVDIIAHSLGGLDARYALSKLDLGGRVRALVTIGTPHHGTPLANFANEGVTGFARKAIKKIGIPLHALDWLSPAALARFNTECPNAPGVRYACVVGGIREAKTPVALTIAAVHAYLRRVSGPNDGLVPISSQYWGETIAEIEADHWEQVGWRLRMRGTFDALALYAFIVARLGDDSVSATGVPPTRATA